MRDLLLKLIYDNRVDEIWIESFGYRDFRKYELGGDLAENQDVLFELSHPPSGWSTTGKITVDWAPVLVGIPSESVESIAWLKIINRENWTFLSMGP